MFERRHIDLPREARRRKQTLFHAGPRGAAEDQADRKYDAEKDNDGGTGGETEEKSGDATDETLLEARSSVGLSQIAHQTPKLLRHQRSEETLRQDNRTS